MKYLLFIFVVSCTACAPMTYEQRQALGAAFQGMQQPIRPINYRSMSDGPMSHSPTCTNYQYGNITRSSCQ